MTERSSIALDCKKINKDKLEMTLYNLKKGENKFRRNEMRTSR